MTQDALMENLDRAIAWMDLDPCELMTHRFCGMRGLLEEKSWQDISAINLQDGTITIEVHIDGVGHQICKFVDLEWGISVVRPDGKSLYCSGNAGYTTAFQRWAKEIYAAMQIVAISVSCPEIRKSGKSMRELDILTGSHRLVWRLDREIPVDSSQWFGPGFSFCDRGEFALVPSNRFDNEKPLEGWDEGLEWYPVKEDIFAFNFNSEFGVNQTFVGCQDPATAFLSLRDELAGDSYRYEFEDEWERHLDGFSGECDRALVETFKMLPTSEPRHFDLAASYIKGQEKRGEGKVEFLQFRIDRLGDRHEVYVTYTVTRDGRTSLKTEVFACGE